MKAEQKKKLYESLIDSFGFSTEESDFLKSIYSELIKDIKDLYALYTIIKKGMEITCCLGDVTANPVGDNVEITCGDRHIVIARGELKLLIPHVITLFEDILPQGTLVELDLDKIKVPNPTSTQLVVVISKRFLGDESGPFYQYGGELYPTGNYGTGKILSFTPAAIKRVVHKGYESELEDRFVFEMLDELVVKEHRLSMGFVEKRGE